MTRDEMIEKIARAVYGADGRLPYPWTEDAKHEEWADQWAAMRKDAENIATAVLDLVGPKPLIWKRNGNHWACGRDGLVIRKIASRFTLTRRNSFGQDFDTLEAAQAAAQAHADAAHWANTKMGSE